MPLQDGKRGRTTLSRNSARSILQDNINEIWPKCCHDSSSWGKKHMTFNWPQIVRGKKNSFANNMHINWRSKYRH